MATAAVASWRKLAASVPALKRSSQTLATLGSKVYIYGGELKPREPVDSDVQVLEVPSDLSATAALITPTVISDPSSAPQPRVGSTSSALSSTLYFFSGRGGLAMAPIEEHGAIWSFNPSSSTWASLSPSNPSAPYPEGRSYHAATADPINNAVYIHAGCPEKGRLGDLWKFDVSVRTWTKLADAPAPPRGGTSIALLSGKIYRMNGFDGQHEVGGSVDVYDIAKDVWSSIKFEPDGASGPTPRSVAALLALKVRGRESLVTLFGEHDPSSLGHAGAGKMLSDVWKFDIEAESWEEVKTKVEGKNGEGPKPRGWFDADVMTMAHGDEAVVVHGGLSEGNERLDDAWLLEF